MGNSAITLAKIDSNIKNEFSNAIDLLSQLDNNECTELVKNAYNEFNDKKDISNMNHITAKYLYPIIIDLRRAPEPDFSEKRVEKVLLGKDVIREYYTNIDKSIQKIKDIIKLLNKYLYIEKTLRKN